FLLRRLLHFAEHLAATSLVEADALGVEKPNRLQDARHADGREFARQYGLLPTGRHERHGREVVDLFRPHLSKDVDDGQLVEQVGLVESNLVAQMANALEILGAGSTDNAVDLIALVEEPFGQVAAVLPSDAGDDDLFHVASSLFRRLSS